MPMLRLDAARNRGLACTHAEHDKPLWQMPVESSRPSSGPGRIADFSFWRVFIRIYRNRSLHLGVWRTKPEGEYRVQGRWA